MNGTIKKTLNHICRRMLFPSNPFLIRSVAHYEHPLLLICFSLRSSINLLWAFPLTSACFRHPHCGSQLSVLYLVFRFAPQSVLISSCCGPLSFIPPFLTTVIPAIFLIVAHFAVLRLALILFKDIGLYWQSEQATYTGTYFDKFICPYKFWFSIPQAIMNTLASEVVARSGV